jgi:ATP-dependent DNA helicase RecG
MSESERLRACYQHAVLCYLIGEKMQNSSLRERFGVDDTFVSQVSRVIGLALKQNLIRPADPERPKSGFIPFWA